MSKDKHYAKMNSRKLKDQFMTMEKFIFHFEDPRG